MIGAAKTAQVAPECDMNKDMVEEPRLPKALRLNELAWVPTEDRAALCSYKSASTLIRSLAV